MKMKIRFRPIEGGLPVYEFETRQFRGVVRKNRADGTWTAGTVNPRTDNVICLSEQETRRGAVEDAVRNSRMHPRRRRT